MKKIFHISIFLIVTIALSCAGRTVRFSTVHVIIPPEISNINAEEVRRAVPAYMVIPESGFSLEITVMRFSFGVERLHYDGSGTIVEDIKNGEIRIMAKIKKGGSLEKILFIGAEGNDRDIILHNLSEELRKQFPGE